MEQKALSAFWDIQRKLTEGSAYEGGLYDYKTKELVDTCSSSLTADNISARCAYFNERNSKRLLEFVDNIVDDTKHYAISENYITHLSDIGAQFDVLFVCSNDPRRAAKLFRSYRPILKRKINVVIMVKSTPADRALLLSAGYDDVFDLKTDAREVRVRILSYHRRRRNADPMPTPQQILVNGSLESGMLKAKLTPTEGVVFSRLLEARQRPVPLTVLCNSAPRAQARTRMTSARVLLSRLRKKLGPGLAIICQGHAGYALVHTEGLQSRWARQAAKH